MSNLPPGVTGNEYQIAGPDHEWDDYRECGQEGFTVRTISLYGQRVLEEVIAVLSGNGNVMAALHHLRTAMTEIKTIDVDTPCPFGGDVTLERYRGIESWECPVCRTLHEREDEK
jgi:hypothetical protein